MKSWSHSIYTYIFFSIILIPYILLTYTYIKYFNPTVNKTIKIVIDTLNSTFDSTILIYMDKINNWILVTLPIFILFIIFLLSLEYLSSHRNSLKNTPSKKIRKDSEIGTPLYSLLYSLDDEFKVDNVTLHIANLDSPNAFATGRKGNGHIVLSKKLIKILNYSEIRAVLAHELSHLDSRDILPILIWQYHIKWIFLIKNILLSIILSPLPKRATTNITTKINKTIKKISSIIFLFPLLRKREYQADSDSKQCLGGTDLANALIKINKNFKPEQKVNKKTKQLLFFEKTAKQLSTKYTSKHPPLKKRLDKLVEK